MLMDMLEGLPSRPHEWPNLVAKGYNQYEHSAKTLNETKDTHRNGIIYQAHADIDLGNEFVSVKSNTVHKAFGCAIDNQGVV